MKCGRCGCLGNVWPGECEAGAASLQSAKCTNAICQTIQRVTCHRHRHHHFHSFQSFSLNSNSKTTQLARNSTFLTAILASRGLPRLPVRLPTLLYLLPAFLLFPPSSSSFLPFRLPPSSSVLRPPLRPPSRCPSAPQASVNVQRRPSVLGRRRRHSHCPRDEQLRPRPSRQRPSAARLPRHHPAFPHPAHILLLRRHKTTLNNRRPRTEPPTARPTTTTPRQIRVRPPGERRVGRAVEEQGQVL